MQLHFFNVRATITGVAKICKIQKWLNFAHFNPKNTHISPCKNVQIYKTVLQMNSNRAYMHGYCPCANDFFILFFSIPHVFFSLVL